MSRLIIVSNRLPITVHFEHSKMKVSRSTGGLATALQGPHSRMESIWLGWTGENSHLDASDQQELDAELEKMRACAIPLTPGEVHQFYDGFSNGVLWPLYHYLPENIQLDAWTNWKTYVEVNQKFADHTMHLMQPDDIVWIHDYQLSLVPAMIRKQIPEATIGFFLHTPFPSSEVFRILPWRTEILQGMLGADLIGFHTYSYLQHFTRSLLHVLELESEEGSVRLGDRRVGLGVFPIGIDFERFQTLASSAAVVDDCRRIKSECEGRQMVLGIDRLDYTKGLPRRILAIERLFEREPAWRDKLRFVQVVVPSRVKVGAYQNLRRELNELVGHVNSTWGNESFMPIHFLFRGLSPERLSALYSATDVMLVTPLRDGMNLVAKEFVASRSHDDGVLVLSEFAGAAAELVEAVVVNPYDVDQLAIQIKRALVMSPLERRSRMRNLRARVKGFDAFMWADSFLEALKVASRTRRIPDAPHASPVDEIERLVGKISAFDPLHVVLDYDGTLVPFAQTPSLAIPDNDLIKLLQLLANRPHTVVHIISGRTREALVEWFGNLPVELEAEHGFWSRPQGSKTWAAVSIPEPTWMPQARQLMVQFCRKTPGSFFEAKTSGLVWRYQLVAPDFGKRQAKSLLKKLREESGTSPLDILEGKRLVEVRSHGINKGMLIHRLAEDSAGAAKFLVMGDDLTDEDMFNAVGARGATVHVGPGPSMAHFRLDDYRAARDFLRAVAGSSSSTHSEPTGEPKLPA